MKLIVLVGPAGAGKSSFFNNINLSASNSQSVYHRISQDDQGKEGHLKYFNQYIKNGYNIVVDRMGFSKEQRERYLKPAREAGYKTEIIVFHVPRKICFERIMAREGHPTINGVDVFYVEGSPVEGQIDLEKKAKQANSALDTFFTKYERVEDTEADTVTRLGWNIDTHKTKPAIIIDLDGTLCNIDHRLHHVKHEVKKHNRWDLFNKEVINDGLNKWCADILRHMYQFPIILCSGRVDSCRPDTENWLLKQDIKPIRDYRHLFMRHRSDFRQDYIIKEIILDFEILPRHNVLFAIDDRQQVVDMWRRRGITCLQCAPGDF